MRGWVEGKVRWRRREEREESDGWKVRWRGREEKDGRKG